MIADPNRELSCCEWTYAQTLGMPMVPMPCFVTNQPLTIMHVVAVCAVTFALLYGRAWVGLVGLEAAQKVPAACIGSTSARACEKIGLTRVTYAEDPGIPGWVDCILSTLKEPQLA